MEHDIKISNDGLDFIKSWELCKLESYKDSKGIWTIGYGHTGLIVDRSRFVNIDENTKISKQEAEELLIQDIFDAEDCIDRNVCIELKQSQHDALVSFIFNVGSGNFKRSKLLRALNSNDFYSIPKELCRWYFSGGKPLLGLLRRRICESSLFLSNGI